MKRGRGRPPLTREDQWELRERACALWFEVNREVAKLRAENLGIPHQDIRGKAMKAVAERNGFIDQNPVKALDKFFDRNLLIVIEDRTGNFKFVRLGTRARERLENGRKHLRALGVPDEELNNCRSNSVRSRPN